LEWHNVSTGLSAANKVTNPVSTAGTYYPVCFDATNACYSPAPTTGVTVTITTCGVVTFTGGGVSSGTVTQSVTPSQAKSGSAATDLVPTGGTPGYVYSDGSSDPLCVNPGFGALVLPATSNLVVNSNGSYTYTAPATPGTYYFCVKVCDSASPTPVCSIATYKVVVPGPGGFSQTQTVTTSQAKSGNAASDLVPIGGSGTYTYANGSTHPACIIPIGATASIPVTFNSNGSYSYTAPATPGTYFFCVLVCDTSSPTPICILASYKVIVTAPACVVGTAVPSLKN
jgi:hypothetical protein